MALKPQLLPLVLRGLETSAPRQQGVPGTLTEALNVVTREGSAGVLWEKRAGLSATGTTVAGGGTLAGTQLVSAGEQMLLTGPAGTFAYNSQTDAWARPPAATWQWLSTEVSPAGPAYYVSGDSAQLAINDVVYTCMAWTSNDGSLFLSLRGADDQPIREGLWRSEAYGPKVIAAGGRFYVFYLKHGLTSVDPSTLYWRSVDPSTGSDVAVWNVAGLPPTDAFVGTSTGCWYDVKTASDGSFVLLGHNLSAAPGSAQLYRLNPATGLPALTGPAISIGCNWSGSILAADASVSGVPTAVLSAISNTQTSLVRVNASTLSTPSMTVVESGTFGAGLMAAIPVLGTGCVIGNTAYYGYELAQSNSDSTYTESQWHYIRAAAVDLTTGTLTSLPFTLKGASCIAAKAFVTSGRPVIPALYSEPYARQATPVPTTGPWYWDYALAGSGAQLASTGYLLDMGTGDMIGRYLHGQVSPPASIGWGGTSGGNRWADQMRIPATWTDATGDVHFVSGRAVALLTGGTGWGLGPLYQPTEVYQPCMVRVSSTDPVSAWAQIGSMALAPGGQIWDGSHLTVPFLTPPATLRAEWISGMSGTLTASATYGYVALYRWYDARGREMLSMPSPILQCRTGAGATQRAFRIRVPMYRLDNVAGSSTNRPQCTVELYRTSGDGEEFRLIQVYREQPGDGSRLFNLPNQEFLWIEDDSSDANQALGSLLYTTGGYLEHEAPPPCRVVAAGNGRAYAVSTDDGSIWFTSPISEGKTLRWSTILRQIVADDTERVTACQVIDGSLVLFKRRGIWVQTGTLPGEIGTGVIPPLARLPGDIGCLHPRAIASLDVGLVFQSDRGLYMLDRGRTLREIGQPVERYYSMPVSAILLRPDEQEILVLPSVSYGIDRALCWNYQRNVWSEFTGWRCHSAVMHGTTAYVASSDGVVAAQTAGVYSDLGVAYSMSITVADIAFWGLEGFGRLWAFQILGEYVGPHRLEVDVYQDFRDDPSETMSCQPDSGTVGYYGSVIYGAQVYGVDITGAGGPYRYQFRPKYQRCTSARLVIRDVPLVTGAETAGFKLNSITFKIGMTGGLMRVGRANVATSNLS